MGLFINLLKYLGIYSAMEIPKEAQPGPTFAPNRAFPGEFPRPTIIIPQPQKPAGLPPGLRPGGQEGGSVGRYIKDLYGYRDRNSNPYYSKELTRLLYQPAYS